MLPFREDTLLQVMPIKTWILNAVFYTGMCTCAYIEDSFCCVLPEEISMFAPQEFKSTFLFFEEISKVYCVVWMMLSTSSWLPQKIMSAFVATIMTHFVFHDVHASSTCLLLSRHHGVVIVSPPRLPFQILIFAASKVERLAAYVGVLRRLRIGNWLL